MSKNSNNTNNTNNSNTSTNNPSKATSKHTKILSSLDQAAVYCTSDYLTELVSDVYITYYKNSPSISGLIMSYFLSISYDLSYKSPLSPRDLAARSKKFTSYLDGLLSSLPELAQQVVDYFSNDDSPLVHSPFEPDHIPFTDRANRDFYAAFVCPYFRMGLGDTPLLHPAFSIPNYYPGKEEYPDPLHYDHPYIQYLLPKASSDLDFLTHYSIASLEPFNLFNSSEKNPFSDFYESSLSHDPKKAATKVDSSPIASPSSIFTLYVIYYIPNVNSLYPIPLYSCVTPEIASSAISLLVFYYHFEHFAAWCQARSLTPLFNSFAWSLYISARVYSENPDSNSFSPFIQKKVVFPLCDVPLIFNEFFIFPDLGFTWEAKTDSIIDAIYPSPSGSVEREEFFKEKKRIIDKILDGKQKYLASLGKNAEKVD